MSLTIPDIIAAKRDGLELSRDSISEIVMGYVNGDVPPEQVSAWLMAVVLKGMSSRETSDLTDVMLRSGDTLDLSDVPGPHVDKHSTGGVGDKTSIVVVPMLAACGATTVKMSGRGLGFSGGTLDRLEAIPGFQVWRTIDQMLAQARDIGACMVGQTAQLVPADKVLYALRDVTGTVPSIPLIASSIMSKKLAGGAETIVLDVKTGSGSFMPTVESARELAQVLVRIGLDAGRRMFATITDMSQPLGDTVGNALELREAILTLTPGAPHSPRFRELCVALCGHALLAAGLCASGPEAVAKAERALLSGDALTRFRAIVRAQGGDVTVVDDPARLQTAPVRLAVVAERSGVVATLDARAVGEASVALGAGRIRRDDVIDLGVGFEIHAHIGSPVARGDTLVTVYAKNADDAAVAAASVRSAVEISDGPVTVPPLIHDSISAY